MKRKFGKTNLEKKLDQFSIRAKKLIASPEHFLEEISAGFLVSLDKNDRILTVSHGRFQSDVEFIFAEVLAKFSANKKIPEIWSIHFREIESFLRDENHLPAFEIEQIILEDVLSKLKNEMVVAAASAALLTHSGRLQELLNGWDTLTLSAKNAFLTEIIRPLECELILYSDDVLTVQKTTSEVGNQGLESVVLGILGAMGKVLPIKVVAV